MARGRGRIADVSEESARRWGEAVGVDIDTASLRLLPYLMLSSMDNHLDRSRVREGEARLLDRLSDRRLIALSRTEVSFANRGFYDLCCSILYEAYTGGRVGGDGGGGERA